MPVAEKPSQLDSAVPAAVVLGFGALLVVNRCGRRFQLRAAMRTPPKDGPDGPDGTGRAEPEAVNPVDSSKPS